MAANGREIIQRRTRLAELRANHDARWERMAPLIAPSRVGIAQGKNIGDPIMTGLYDSTTPLAAEQMANFIAGHIINPGQQWLGYTPADYDIRDDDESREFCEECRSRTLRRAQSSNFYSEGPESLIDYGGFGTGCKIVEEQPQPVNGGVRGFRGFMFTAVKTGRFYIAEGSNGLVDTIMRDIWMPLRIILDRWPNANLPGKMRQAKEAGKTDEQFHIVHAIYPRPKAEVGGYSANKMPWASCWVDHDSREVLFESGYRVFPGAVPRYQKTPGDVYGRGRGDLAFPDTWTLNSAKRMGLEDWALKLRPPLFVRSDAVIGTLRLVPAGPTSINTYGQKISDVVMPYQTGSNPQVDSIKEEELRRTIREVFYVDAIRQLLEVSKSEMTAFEFARKIELLFRLLGPVYGRLQWEDLYQTTSIMFELMYYAGDFPPPPPRLLESSGRIEVEFLNPIAKAQRAGDAEALMMAMNDVAAIGQVSPEFVQLMLDRLDPDESMVGILATRGVPAKWIRNDSQVEAKRKARAEMDEQANQMANLQAASEVGKNVAPLAKALTGNGNAAK